MLAKDVKPLNWNEIPEEVIEKYDLRERWKKSAEIVGRGRKRRLKKLAEEENDEL